MGKMTEKMPVFWGCTFMHNYPFLMRSIRAAMESVGLGLVELKDVGCCPDPVYVRAYDEDSHLALSARNLAIAERQGGELLVPCNGCYSVLHGAKKRLDEPNLRDEVNKLLPGETGYGGDLEVIHIMQELDSKLPIIKTLVRKPLEGLRVAVHYGCHALYPPVVKSDTAENPTSMDELVKVLGAESIDYDSKLDCCGVSVAAFDREESRRLLLNKLKDIKGKADCIVTACPGCFLSFDSLPSDMKEFSIPVLHISELMALAFGIPSQELFLEGHQTKADSVIEKIDSKQDSEIVNINRNFNPLLLNSHCEACRKECTASLITKNFDPLDVIDKLKQGRLNEVLESDDIWKCLQCGRCEERCPNNIGLKDTFSKLRELALEKGHPKPAVRDKVRMLKETGYILPARTGIRKRMGTGPAPSIDSKNICSILKKAEDTRCRD